MQVFRLSTVHIKINQIPFFMSLFEPQVSFPLNSALPLSVMTQFL